MSRAISLGTLLEGWCAFDSDTNENRLAVSGLRVDAGAIEPGDAYVAVARADGHGIAQAAQAASRGAAVVLHDGAVVAPRLDIPVLAVPGLEARLGELGARFHRHPAEHEAHDDGRSGGPEPAHGIPPFTRFGFASGSARSRRPW